MADITVSHIILLTLQCCTAPMSTAYFYWAVIVLILHRKNWSTPSVLIAMIHWLFCSLSVCFANLDNFYENYEEKNLSKANWLVSQVISTCFNYSAQIVGDWYPMLLIVNQDKLSQYIKISCVIANCAKLLYMGLYIFTPFISRTDIINSNFYEYRHYIQILISLTTIAYHANIFYYLRTRFCLKYKEIMKSQNFLTKFRRISQYRIMISSGYILCSTPFVIFYIFIILFDKRKEIDSGDYARNTFFSVPYYILYIDQILLKNLVVVKPTSNTPAPYNRISGCSANSETESKMDDHSTTISHTSVEARPQVTARPMLFNNWSAPEGWSKPEYLKPSDRPQQQQQQPQPQLQPQPTSPLQTEQEPQPQPTSPLQTEQELPSSPEQSQQGNRLSLLSFHRQSQEKRTSFQQQ